MPETPRPRLQLRRLMTRWAADPHVLLAIAIVLSVLAIEVISSATVSATVATIVVPAVAYLAIQLSISVVAPRGRQRSELIETGRLLIGVAAIFVMGVWAGQVATMPLFPLYVPMVAMAAAIGWRPTFVIGAISLAAFVLPLVIFRPEGVVLTLGGTVAMVPIQIQRGIALIAATIVLVVGTRRTVGALERAIEQARTANAGQRRRARQMSAVEAVGRALAANGPSTSALEDVMDVLVARFGYRYVSIYTVEGDHVRLGAQRGYANPVETFQADVGVVGRVLRTGEVAFLPDVAGDPDYVAADPEVASEVSVPLTDDGVVIGVLNVESTAGARLDEGDRDTMIVVADRIAAALALGRERQALHDRAALLARIADFGAAINASLDAETALRTIADSVAQALDADIAVVVTRDATTGEDRIAAMHGGDERYVGVSIPPGEGLSGRAIAARGLVADPEHVREALPSTVRGARAPDAVAAAAMPLIVDDEVIGALTLARIDLSRPFTTLEQDGFGLIAAQVALAVRNIGLHAQVSEAAIRDPLTGVWNRRQLDIALDRLFAVRARQEPEHRHPVSAILFDLDHFGAFNKQHGHATGDAVLRVFGTIINRRFRSSDVVARFGGEEFVAVLDGANLDEARRVAEEVRREFEGVVVEGADGRPLRATVSAGCASLGPDVASFETLLEVADVALQMAKRGGRNQVVAA